eukprot:TRINITY_DN29889_c0_g1_i1.p1 TRINITY_DN29889_c0_g1~~TRINITY_DN29889_c0_g1_i1.p1  ORF type:complete len:1293 (+),score=772.87 TRINITY_DN29889_c0_g1_i1:68-3946(+)
MAAYGRRMRLRRMYDEDGGGYPYHNPGVEPQRGRSTVEADAPPSARVPSAPAEDGRLLQPLPPAPAPGDAGLAPKLREVDARVGSLEVLLRRAEESMMRADSRSRQQEGLITALLQRTKDLEAHGATRDGAARRAALDGERLGGRLEQLEQAVGRRLEEQGQAWQTQLAAVEDHARRLAQQAREGALQSTQQAVQEAATQLRAATAADVDAVAGKLRQQQDAAAAQVMRHDEALVQLGAAAQRAQQDADDLRRKSQELAQTSEHSVRQVREATADAIQQLRQSTEAALQRERQQRERDAAERLQADAAARPALVQQCAEKVAGELGKEMRRAEGFAETAAQRMDAIEELLKAEIRSRMELGTSAERVQEELRRLERTTLSGHSTLEGSIGARIADVQQALSGAVSAAKEQNAAMYDTLRDSFIQNVERVQREAAEARRVLAARVESTEQGLTEAAQRDTTLQYRAADAERLLEELRGLQERDALELRSSVTRAENRWEEELRTAQKQTTEWVQQQVGSASREAAARETHVKEFCVGETAKVGDVLLQTQRDTEHALNELKRSALQVQQEVSAEVRRVEDKVAAAAQQAKERSEEVLQKGLDDRAGMSHRLELTEQRLAQLSDHTAGGMQSIREDVAERDRALAAKQEERDRRERDAGEQRLRREREKEDEHERALAAQQQRLEQRGRELEQDLRRAERALAAKLEQAAAGQRELSTALAEQTADVRAEARRLSQELGVEVRALQEHAQKRTQEAEKAAREATQELRDHIHSLQQESQAQLTALARLSDEREEAARVREEDRDRAARDRHEDLERADAQLDSRLAEAVKLGQDRDKQIAENERKAEGREKAQQACNRGTAADVSAVKEGLLLLTKQTGDDQQATNSMLEMLNALLKTSAETVREDLVAELQERLDEAEGRAADAARSRFHSDEAGRRYAEQLHQTALTTAQQNNQMLLERIDQLTQRAAALEGRHDAAQLQLEQAVESRMHHHDNRWEEKRLQDVDKVAALERQLTTCAADLRDVLHKVQQADDKLDQRYDAARKSAAERVDSLERWKERCEERLRKQEDGAEQRRREQGKEASSAALLESQIRALEEALESLRGVVTRLSDEKPGQGGVQAAEWLRNDLKEIEERLVQRLSVVEEREQGRIASDTAWDQWQKGVDRRLAALGVDFEKRAQEGGAGGEVLQQLEMVMGDLSRAAVAAAEADEADSRQTLVMCEGSVRTLLCESLIHGDRLSILEDRATDQEETLRTTRDELKDYIHELGAQMEDFLKGEEEEEDRRIRGDEEA